MIILFHVLEFKSYEIGSIRDFVGGKRDLYWWEDKELSLKMILNQGKGEISLINQYGGEELIYGLFFMVDVLWCVLYALCFDYSMCFYVLRYMA